MTVSDFSLTVLGSRGSMAFCGDECARYGGDSSCYMVRAGEETVFLDAGTGLSAAPTDYPKSPIILLSHLHLDHLIGLGVFPGLSNSHVHTKVYVPFCTDRSEAEEILGRVFAPPFWPLRLTEYASRPELLPLPESFSLGKLGIDCIPGNHPGGCMAFRLCYKGRTIVYITDYEYEAQSFARLITFSKKADLLLFDAQYTENELTSKSGFGHSSAGMGIKFMAMSGAKKLLLIHHDPHSHDPILTMREKKLAKDNISYARTGQRIYL